VVELADTYDLPAGRQAQNRINKMYYTYAIKSRSKSYIYVGISDNTERRIAQHNRGLNRTTKPYKPFNTIILEEYSDRKQARKREKYLKSGCGKEFLKNF